MSFPMLSMSSDITMSFPMLSMSSDITVSFPMLSMSSGVTVSSRQNCAKNCLRTCSKASLLSCLIAPTGKKTFSSASIESFSK